MPLSNLVFLGSKQTKTQTEGDKHETDGDPNTYLMDPYSKNGYEHFYDRERGSGYLAWRLKTIQRKSVISEGRRSPRQLTGGGPKARREASFSPEVALSEEQCREAMSFMKHSTDEAAIKQKMKLTFEFCCKMIEQDFILLFGEEIAAKFLERWPATFKQKVIQQSKALPTSSDLEELIHCAEAPSYEEEMDDDTLASGWDSDLSSILLLLHLIPPSAQGRKRPGKVSSSQAEKRLVVFKKSGTSIQEHVDSIKSATQPYLLAVGMKRSTVYMSSSLFWTSRSYHASQPLLLQHLMSSLSTLCTLCI
ncbi:hypothetical protein L3Q82_019964, partial [Scortum barcoo]